jgi:hypothetical protein
MPKVSGRVTGEFRHAVLTVAVADVVRGATVRTDDLSGSGVDAAFGRTEESLTATVAD